jgi:uncharacterized protein YbjT (DUF2867 family)
MAYKKVAVIGASGLLGQPVVRQLAKAGFDLTLVSRDSSKLKATFGDLDVNYVEAESSDTEGLTNGFRGTSHLAANAGIDAVVSVIGSLALASQNDYIDAAVAAGVKRFIPSEFGCDTQSPLLYLPRF